MAFQKKEWLRRIVEFPGRRKITPSGIENVYNIERAEGDVLQAGDGFTKENMDDLEERIAAEFKVTQSLAPTELIPRNSDLDDYTDPGCFRVADSAVAKTILHTPITNAGYMLDVYKPYGPGNNGIVMQIARVFDFTELVRYHGFDNKWSDWEKRNIPMTGATASAAGKAGLVPTPDAGTQNKFLKGNGAWADVFIARGEYTGNIDNLYGYENIGTYFVLSTNITGTLPDDIGAFYYVLVIFTASPNICIQLMMSLNYGKMYMRGRTANGWLGWFSLKKIVYSSFSDFPAVGDPQVLYIDDTTDPRLMYTWDSSTSKYVLTGGAGGADGSSIDIPITLPASGWTGTAAPYSQTVTVPQIRETMTPLLYFSGTGDAAQYAYSLITGYEAGYAQMTFSAADKPQVDIPITLKGVPAQQLEFADNTVVVVVPADGFALNEDVGRYEQTITVEGMTPGMGGMFDIVRSGPVLTVEESKIVSNITDIIRLEDAIKIVCLEPPEQQYMLALYGTFTQAAEGTTLLAGMQGWFDKVEELEKGSLFYVDHKLTITANSGLTPWSAYGVKNVSVASATPVSAQIIGGSSFYGSVTLNVNNGSMYVYGAIAGEYTIRVLYSHTD